MPPSTPMGPEGAEVGFQALGCRVEGLGFRVSGLGFGVKP